MRKSTEFEKFLVNITSFVRIFNSYYGTDYSVEPHAGTNRITITFLTKKERWATKMADKARKAANRGELTIDFQGHMTLVHSVFTGRTGVAIRSLCDKDDIDLGIAIAYCRAMHYPIPDFVFE